MNLCRRLIELCDVQIKYHTGYNCYDSDYSTIYINYMNDTLLGDIVKFVSGRPTTQGWTLYHETGHAFFETYCVDHYQESWDLFGDFNKEYPEHGLLTQMGRSAKGAYLTNYCQEHPEEDFAECFAHVLCNFKNPLKGIRNKTLKKKITYVHDYIVQILDDYE